MIEIKEKVSRFSGCIWAKEIEKYPALIVGLGATGSYLSFFLARAGVKQFKLIDFDKYEAHNINSQMASHFDIGEYKTNASQKFLLDYTDVKIINLAQSRIENTYSSEFIDNKIICATLDSMSGRKYMFEQFVANCKDDSIFFDSRIGAEYWEVYCIPRNSPEKIERYKETLFDDTKGNIGACNYQQSSHSACGAALKIVELTTNWITNIITEDNILPFKITNDIRTNNYGVYY